MSGVLKQAVDAIIRPPRVNYNVDEMPLFLKCPNGKSRFIRHPLKVNNIRNELIQCSIYHSDNMDLMTGGPMVVYLHGNSSTQREGQFLVPNFCPHGVFVFCFDFAGCGQSDGSYITLGHNEATDLDFLLDILSTGFKMGPFVLWGRSMGAATALLTKNSNVVGIISDSAFTSIDDMISDIGRSNGLPSFLTGPSKWLLGSRIRTLAGFDIHEVSPINAVKQLKIPILIGQAEDDQLIPFTHSIELLNAYGTQQKTHYILKGGHNGCRDKNWITAGVCFALEQLKIFVLDVQISENRSLQTAGDHFSSFSSMINNNRQKNDPA